MTTISYVDHDRSACLCAVGGGPYVAATLVAPDGRQDLVLVRWDLLGDEHSTYDQTTPDAPTNNPACCRSSSSAASPSSADAPLRPAH